VRFFVVVVIFFTIIVTPSVGFNNLGCEHRPETTLSEFFVYTKVYFPELQRESLSVARRAARGISAGPHLFSGKFLQAIKELRISGHMMVFSISWEEREQCRDDLRVKRVARIRWVKGRGDKHFVRQV
jgi:hypothetical protein